MERPTYHLSGVIQRRDQEPEDFSGPLDVILLLLSRNRIQIRDIQISLILEQYLEYLEEMRRMDLEIASEFITMASQLMLIKTKMLLSMEEQQEGLSEMELLIQSLEQRQRQEILEKLRGPAAWLETRNDIGRGRFPKDPEPLKRDPTYRYVHDREDLIRAAAALRDRENAVPASPAEAFSGIVGREPYPVETKATEVLRRLFQRGRMKLRNLFRGSRSRSELVATFLSLLELCKLRSVEIRELEGEQIVDYLGTPEEVEG